MPGHVIVAGHGHVVPSQQPPETVACGLIGTLVPGTCWKIPPGMSTFA